MPLTVRRRRQFELYRSERRLELSRAARADDYARHSRVREEPRERECSHRRALLRRAAFEILEEIEDSVVLQVLVRPGAHGHARTGRRWLVAPVLAGQPATCERAERREAEAVLDAEREQLWFHAAVEQRVRVLHPPVVARALAGGRLPQLLAVDVARTVRLDLALA